MDTAIVIVVGLVAIVLVLLVPHEVGADFGVYMSCSYYDDVEEIEDGDVNPEYSSSRAYPGKVGFRIMIKEKTKFDKLKDTLK